MRIRHEDRLLIRELYRPTDGAKPLPAREIAEKWGVGLHVVYRIVNMSEARLLWQKYRDDE
jgi:DNA invertase Pin-like site-specific DNA recombinase